MTLLLRKSLALTACLLISLATWAGIYNADNLPMPENNSYQQYTSNPDGILSSASVKHVEDVLYRLDHNADIKALVIAVEHVEGDDIFGFTEKVYNKYGIGTKGTDRGFILALATEDRSYQIMTGYGLEAELPDIVCGQIERKVMVPHLKNGDWNMAITATLDTIASILTSGDISGYSANEDDVYGYNDDSYDDDEDDLGPFGNALVYVIMVLIIVFCIGLSLRILLFIPNLIYLHYHKSEDVETKRPNFWLKTKMFLRDSVWRTGNTYYYYDDKGNDQSYEVKGVRWHKVVLTILWYILLALLTAGKGGGSRGGGRSGGSRGGGRSGGGGAGGRF